MSESVDRLNRVIEREEVSSQTFEDLEKSLSEPSKEVKSEEQPKNDDPQGNGEAKANAEPDAKKKADTGEGVDPKPEGEEKKGDEQGEDKNPAKPSEEKGKPDKPEKPDNTAQQNHAWQKLRTQNRDYKREIARLKQELEKYKPVERADYNEDQFANKADFYRVVAHEQNQIDRAKWKTEELNEQIAALERAERDQTIIQRETALFPTEKEYGEYCQIVNSCMQSGMKNALDANPDIMEFIDNSDMGPRLLYHFAMKPQDFKQIADNPNKVSRSFMLSQLERGLYEHFVLKPQGQGAGANTNTQVAQPPVQTPPASPNPAPQGQQSKKEVPVIGKLGTGADKSTPDLSESEVMKIYRKYTT